MQVAPWRTALLSLWLFLCAAMTCAQSARSSAHSPSDDAAWYEKKVALHETGSFDGGILHVLRLQPGEDLRDSLAQFARAKGFKAATLVTCVGSLSTANIRLSDAEDGSIFNGPFEIVSLVGMVDFQRPDLPSYKGDGHIHISISDGEGKTIGGHLLSGSKVYTTAEISLLEIKGALFQRLPDNGPNGSGYMELKVFNESFAEKSS